MSYRTRYRIPILNPGVAGVIDSETPYAILIEEKDYNGNPTTLKGSVGAAVLRYINNDERKYQPICGSELSISFYSEENFSLQDIITDDDFQFRVIISNEDYRGDNTYRPVWVGWISTDDCFEQMQDDPKIINLKATDGVAFLKKQELYDIDVYEKKTLLEIIERCISFIGPPINLQIECDVFEESMTDKTTLDTAHPFDQCIIHTRSFLKDANTYTDAYATLEHIMNAFQCSFFQQNGRWVIKRHHDRWNNSATKSTILSHPYTSSDHVGKLYDYDLSINYTDRLPISADHQRSYVGASQFTKLQYDYEVPKQVPRNNNFQQGDFLAPVSGANNTATRIDYWLYQVGSNTSPETVASVPYRNQTFDPDTGAPKENYIVLPRRNPALNEDERLVSEQVDVASNDRVTVSGEFKTKYHTTGAGNMFVLKIVLRAYSGTVYSLDYTVGSVTNAIAEWVNNIGQTVLFSFGSDYDLTQWQSFTVETPAFPEDGTIEFWLYEGSLANDGNQTWYKNINFNWDLFVNNSTQIKGEYDKIEKSGTFRNNIEQAIQIGNAPKKIISGALFQTDESTLTQNWHRQGKDEVEKLIRINDIALYQSSYRLYSKIEGSFLNISYTDPDDEAKKILIGPANSFKFSFLELTSKRYISTNLEINLSENTFRAFLQEFYDEDKDNGDPQGETRTFNYIYE